MVSPRRNILLCVLAVSFLILLPVGIYAQTPPPPAANDDAAATEQNLSVTIDVLANDTETENVATITNTAPANGIVVKNADNTFTYTPNLDFSGTDTFTYEICDSATPTPACDTATVTIEVALAEIEVEVNVIPQKLNVKKMGVLPVAILGIGDFDVATIDPASIRLEGVAPLRSNVEEEDGVKVLTLKFSAQEIVAAIGEVFDGDVVVLELTDGTLKEEAGGNPIVGEDSVIILKKGKARPPKDPKPPKGPKGPKGPKK